MKPVRTRYLQRFRRYQRFCSEKCNEALQPRSWSNMFRTRLIWIGHYSSLRLKGFCRYEKPWNGRARCETRARQARATKKLRSGASPRGGGKPPPVLTPATEIPNTGILRRLQIITLQITYKSFPFYVSDCIKQTSKHTLILGAPA